MRDCGEGGAADYVVGEKRMTIGGDEKREDLEGVVVLPYKNYLVGLGTLLLRAWLLKRPPAHKVRVSQRVLP